MRRKLAEPPSWANVNGDGVWTGSELISWGKGRWKEDGSGKEPDHAVAYSPEAETWRDLAPPPVAARDGQSSVWTESEVIFWGGRHSLFDESDNDGVAYDPVAKGDRMFVWRGGALDVYDIDADAWTNLGSFVKPVDECSVVGLIDPSKTRFGCASYRSGTPSVATMVDNQLF